MDCPKCTGYRLKPIKLEYSLPGLTCGKCHGVLLSLLSYRNWVEQHVPDNEELLGNGSEAISPDDTKNALLCPKCKHIMTKYRIGSDTDNRVDLCACCDEAWLDDGEWKLLKQLELQNKLPDICSSPWQRNIRRTQAKENYEDRYRQLLGDEDYQKLVQTKDWVDEHDQRKHLRFYLNRLHDVFDS